jgi:ABC-type methionine transport system permease subunit
MEVTSGFWWRTFLVVVAANVLAALPGLALSVPLTALAESSNRAVWSLAGTIVTEMLTTPFVALVATFLYFDLRARRT